MKTNQIKQMTTQVRFTLALHATWSVLRDPVLTNIYLEKWQGLQPRPTTKEISPYERLLTLYGFIFNLMYKEV